MYTVYTRRVAEAATLVAAPKPNLNRQSLCNYTAIFAESTHGNPGLVSGKSHPHGDWTKKPV